MMTQENVGHDSVVCPHCGAEPQTPPRELDVAQGNWKHEYDCDACHERYEIEEVVEYRYNVSAKVVYPKRRAGGPVGV